MPTEPRSPITENKTWGVAGGETQEEVDGLIATVEVVLPVYREMYGFADEPLHIHVVDDLWGYDLPAGMTIHRSDSGHWILVRRTAKDPASVIAHEMAHFFFREHFAKFPQVLEEGMCDSYAARVIASSAGADEDKMVLAMVSYLDHVRVDVRGVKQKAALAHLLLNTSTVEEALRLDSKDVLEESDAWVSAANYGLGWMFAQTIGLEELSELARRCDREGLDEVPTEWILEAAGLVPLNQETLAIAFVKALGVADGEWDGKPPLITMSD